MIRRSRNRIRRLRHRGFVMIVAISLLALAGATLAVMATLFAGEAKRVQAASAETQLRQLLVAGEAVARSRLNTGAATQAVKVELPEQLAGAEVTVAGDAGNVRIEAQFLGRHAAQTVSYVRDGDKWRIAKVTLDAH
jgi:hypothetical protein